jgi:hypothetical protein
MNGGVNGDGNKGGDIKERGKITIRTINSLPYKAGEKEQFRNGKRLYGTINDKTVIAALRKRPDLFRLAD